LGKVPNADEFLNNLDVFILTSKYEGFGLVILESLRSGVVLLSSKSEAAIEILGEEYKGLFGIHDSKSLANLMGRIEGTGVSSNASKARSYGIATILN